MGKLAEKEMKKTSHSVEHNENTEDIAAMEAGKNKLEPLQRLHDAAMVVPANVSSGRVRLRVRASRGVAEVLEFHNITVPVAVRRAVARGYTVLSIEDESSHAGASLQGERITKGQFPLLLFSQELLALLEAGLNLTEALDTLIAKERNHGSRTVLSKILEALQEGKSFSDVLASIPDIFPPVYVATVKASERTGDMPQSLARYIAYQIQFDGIRKKLISASIYPAMLLIVGSFVTLFLLGYVVPRFASVYETSGRQIPFLSALLLDFGRAIHQNWQWALLGLAICILLSGWIALTVEGRAWIISKFLELPGIAKRSEEFRLGRFYRALGLLLESGVALPRAMSMVGGLLSQDQKRRLRECQNAVENGQNFSTALAINFLSTPIADSLLKVGERSGKMADMLERTAKFIDDDFTRWIDWASRLLEPILMILIGLIIGTVVVLMYMPIFELAGSLQ